MLRSNRMSRSSSLSSNSSSHTITSASNSLLPSRRTRKKFTREQLMLLEDAFHKASHPSREARDSLVKSTGLDLKSITIWFQNKRQTDRKVAMYNSTNNSASDDPSTYCEDEPIRARTMSDTRATKISQENSRNNNFTLDRVASQSELPLRPPRTPRAFTRADTAPGALWDSMLSSPLQPYSPSCSPKARSKNFVDFAKTQHKKTLEWACASALVAQNEPLETAYNPLADMGWRNEVIDIDMDELTDDDSEVVTPEASQCEMPWISDALASIQGQTGDQKTRTSPLDEDIMTAAWALCGLKGM